MRHVRILGVFILNMLRKARVLIQCSIKLMYWSPYVGRRALMSLLDRICIAHSQCSLPAPLRHASPRNSPACLKISLLMLRCNLHVLIMHCSPLPTHLSAAFTARQIHFELILLILNFHGQCGAVCMTRLLPIFHAKVSYGCFANILLDISDFFRKKEK
jgi:hypothetical protein